MPIACHHHFNGALLFIHHTPFFLDTFVAVADVDIKYDISYHQYIVCGTATIQYSQLSKSPTLFLLLFGRSRLSRRVIRLVKYFHRAFC